SGIAVDSLGNAYVTGQTASADFPTVNPIQSSFHSQTCTGEFGSYQCGLDAFVAKIGSTLAVSSFSPAKGRAGATVAIYGAQFTGTPASFTVVSANQISATVPAGAPSGKIKVATPAGTSTSAGTFTVSSSAAPTISSFSPASGLVGTNVTVNGALFTGTTGISF